MLDKEDYLQHLIKHPNAANNMFEMLSSPSVGIGASIFTKLLE